MPIDLDNQRWADLPLKQRIALLILFLCILATGFSGAEQESVMPDTDPHVLLCPRYNAEGKELVASMVMASYKKNAAQPHECIYERSKG